MQRPQLNEIPLKSIFDTPSVIVTMAETQWDNFLEVSYNTGCVLLEVDHDEISVKAYRKG